MLRLIFWILVLFLALSFFNISLRAIIDSPAGQQNLLYLQQLASLAWQWIVNLVR